MPGTGISRLSSTCTGVLVRGAMTPRERKDNVYVHGPDKGFSGRLIDESSLVDGEWERGGAHGATLVQEGALFESVVPKFPEVRHPTLLVRGYYTIRSSGTTGSMRF